LPVLSSSKALASPRAPWPAVAPVATSAAQPAPQTIELEVTAEAMGGEDDPAAPSQRQVELAVAATDQLIESLQRETGAKRVSVRVVLRTGEQSTVEAAAEWEAP
jgi:hypothetical protein